MIIGTLDMEPALKRLLDAIEKVEEMNGSPSYGAEFLGEMNIRRAHLDAAQARWNAIKDIYTKDEIKEEVVRKHLKFPTTI